MKFNRACFTRTTTATIFIFIFALCAAARAQEIKTFHSDALGTDKQYRLYLPPGYDTDKDTRYPVVYLLHGYNFIRNVPGSDISAEMENHWVIQENIVPVADCLFTVKDYDALTECIKARGVEFPEAVAQYMKDEYPESPLPLPKMIIVMPNGDSSFYMNRLDGLKQWPPLDGPDYVDGIYKGATGQYEDYISRDLVAHVDATYRTIPERGKRGIGGFSMGGIGSMNLLLGHPDTYISVSSLSALYTLSDMMNDPLAQGMDKTTPEIKTIFFADMSAPKPEIDKKYLKRNDPYYRLKFLESKDVFVYYDAGANDFFAGMYRFKNFEKFGKLLEEKGMLSWPSRHIVPAAENNGKGQHNSTYWRSRIGCMLAFHAHAFGLM